MAWYPVFRGLFVGCQACLLGLEVPPAWISTLSLVATDGTLVEVSFPLRVFLDEAAANPETFEDFVLDHATVRVVHADEPLVEPIANGLANVPLLRMEMEPPVPAAADADADGFDAGADPEEDEPMELEPLPRPVIAPGIKCLQCNQRARNEQLTCGSAKCQKKCTTCRVNLRLGRRPQCYDCIFADGHGFPICPSCRLPMRMQRGKHCVNCYRRQKRKDKNGAADSDNEDDD